MNAVDAFIMSLATKGRGFEGLKCRIWDTRVDCGCGGRRRSVRRALREWRERMA